MQSFKKRQNYRENAKVTGPEQKDSRFDEYIGQIEELLVEINEKGGQHYMQIDYIFQKIENNLNKAPQQVRNLNKNPYDRYQRYIIQLLESDDIEQQSSQKSLQKNLQQFTIFLRSILAQSQSQEQIFQLLKTNISHKLKDLQEKMERKAQKIQKKLNLEERFLILQKQMTNYRANNLKLKRQAKKLIKQIQNLETLNENKLKRQQKEELFIQIIQNLQQKIFDLQRDKKK